MWQLTKKYWKDVWALLWSKTSVDEKALATLEEFRTRYRLTKEELKDVAKAIKEVGNQIGDIDDAVNKKHGHDNKNQLDKIAEDGNGKLTYDGTLVSSEWITEEF